MQPESLHLRVGPLTVSLSGEALASLARMARARFPDCAPASQTPAFRYRIRPTTAGFDVLFGRRRIATAATTAEAHERLLSHLQVEAATHAPDRLYVHAGAVALHNHALLLPGPSFAGKTTLVTELLRLGAAYLSDEFAVIAPDGLIHPYPRLLRVRDRHGASTRHLPSSHWGAPPAEQPLPAAMIVFTRYSPGARWQPRALSPGEALIRLLAHTPCARTRSHHALTLLHASIANAALLESPRDSARSTAAEIVRLFHRLHAG